MSLQHPAGAEYVPHGKPEEPEPLPYTPAMGTLTYAEERWISDKLYAHMQKLMGVLQNAVEGIAGGLVEPDRAVVVAQAALDFVNSAEEQWERYTKVLWPRRELWAQGLIRPSGDRHHGEPVWESVPPTEWDDRARIWNAYNDLPEGERSPVHAIAAMLGMDLMDVADVVFPEWRFGPWDPSIEPMSE